MPIASLRLNNLQDSACDRRLIAHQSFCHGIVPENLMFRSLPLVLVFGMLSFLPQTVSAAADVYVDNINGLDSCDGSTDTKGAGSVGPVASLERANALLKPGARLILCNTGTPYRGSINLTRKGGTPTAPLVVEGNGATIEGLQETKPAQWERVSEDIVFIKWEAPWGFFVVADGATPKWGKSATELQPGESFGDYNQHRGYFRLPAGRSIDQVKLEIATGGFGSGVLIYDASHIVVRNLRCQYFWNDGFNYGGESEDIRFESIEACYNGDEGASSHGNVSACIVDAKLHHNDNGVADTGFSRTTYYRLQAHDNRQMGVWFQGGEHVVIDSKLWSNPNGVTLELAQGMQTFPVAEGDPYMDCRVLLRNVFVSGDDYAISLSHQTSISVDHATLVGGKRGILLQAEDAKCRMTNSIVSAPEKLLDSVGHYRGDYNCWSSESFLVSGQQVKLDGLGSGLAQEGSHTVISGPLMTDPSSMPPGPAIGTAYFDDENEKWLRNSRLVPQSAELSRNKNMGFIGENHEN